MKQVISVCVCLVWMCPAGAYLDYGSWRNTLEGKAALFEKNADERHNILGTYPSSVILTPPRHYVDPGGGGWKTLVETGELPPGWTVALPM